MSIERPSFLDLFDLWLQDTYKDYVFTASFVPDRERGSLDIVMRVPNDIFTRFNHIIIGEVDDHDVSLVTWKQLGASIQRTQHGYESRNAADPKFFQWFSATLKRENFDEVSRIEKMIS